MKAHGLVSDPLKNAPAAAPGLWAGLANPSAFVALVSLILGAAALAYGAVFVRQSELPPTASAVYRVGLAFPLLFVVAFLWPSSSEVERRRKFFSKEYLPLVLVGFIFSGNLALYHWSIHLTTLANSNLLANLAPIFVVLGAKLIFGQRFKKGFAVGMFIALAGSFLLISARVDLGATHLLGGILGVLTAVFYGSYLLAVSRVRSNFSTLAVMAWSSLGTFLVLLPLTVAMGEPLLPRTLHGWAVLLALALISHVAGQGLIAYALVKLPAPVSAVTLLVQPVIAVALGWHLFDEKLLMTEFIGALVVLAGIHIARRHST